MIIIASRVLRQVRHDPRTLAIVVVMPMVLVWLLHELFGGAEPLSSRVEMTMLGIFPLTIMFLLTAVATVRERSDGTLERLMSSPVKRGDIVGGYALAFGMLGVAQSLAMTAFCYWALNMQLRGSVAWVLLVSLSMAMLGIAFGLLASSISTSEFQAVQLMPVLLLPQILLCGLFGDRGEMAGWLHTVSDLMPATWSVEALNEIAASPDPSGHYWTSLGIVVACALGALVLASLTLRRRTA